MMVEQLNDASRRYQQEYDRVQAELAVVDQTIAFLIKLKANLQLESTGVLDKLAKATTRQVVSLTAKH